MLPPYVNPPPDPATPEALELLRRLGCSFRLVPFFPGPDKPPSAYPIEVSPPPGFHFDDRQHDLWLPTWADVLDRLNGARVVCCDERCDRREPE